MACTRAAVVRVRHHDARLEPEPAARPGPPRGRGCPRWRTRASAARRAHGRAAPRARSRARARPGGRRRAQAVAHHAPSALNAGRPKRELSSLSRTAPEPELGRQRRGARAAGWGRSPRARGAAPAPGPPGRAAASRPGRARGSTPRRPWRRGRSCAEAGARSRSRSRPPARRSRARRAPRSRALPRRWGRRRRSGCRRRRGTRRPSTRCGRRSRARRRGSAPPRRAARATMSADGSTSNGSRTRPMRSRVSQPRIGLAREREQLLQLALDVPRGLARQRAALDVEHAALGVARQLLAARDQRGVQAGRAEQRVRPRVEAVLQRRDAGERGGHADDRVDAEVGARAVRRAALGLELRPHEALVRDARAQVRRLGDDAGVGAPAAQDRLDALAGVLLVGHRGDDHVAAAARRGRPPRRPTMIAARPPFMS